MQKMATNVVLAALVVLGSAGYSLAQAEHSMAHGEDFQSMGAVHLELAGPDDRDNAKGIPLTADIVNTHVQYLQDGNKITNEETSHFYRDSEGRTRRENKLVLPGREGSAPTMIMINDPIAHTKFVLNTVRKSADELPPPGAPGSSDVMFVRKHMDERMANGPQASNENKEDLGTQSVEGVTAHGTRTSHVIAAGKIGNEKPITVTTESWFSDELGMEVLRIHKDPWSGEVTTKVINVRRGEPEAALFTPPADYKVEKGNQRVIRLETKHMDGAPPQD
jgi:hypothetical protein